MFRCPADSVGNMSCVYKQLFHRRRRRRHRHHDHHHDHHHHHHYHHHPTLRDSVSNILLMERGTIPGLPALPMMVCVFPVDYVTAFQYTYENLLLLSQH